MYIKKLLDLGVWMGILKGDHFFHEFLIFQGVVITVFLIFFIPRLKKQQLKLGSELKVELVEMEKDAQAFEKSGDKIEAKKIRCKIAWLEKKYRNCLDLAKKKEVYAKGGAKC